MVFFITNMFYELTVSVKMQVFVELAINIISLLVTLFKVGKVILL